MRFLSFILVAASVVLPALTANAQTNILFNRFTPPGFIINTGIINPWLEEIETVTEGRVVIELTDTNLAPPPEQLTMVEDGVADGAYQFLAFLANRAPLVQLALLPKTSYGAEADSVALWRTYEQYFADRGEFDSVQLLGFFQGTPGSVFALGDEALTTIDQFDGLTIWSLPAGPAQAIGATGAAVVPGPAVQAYDIISRGTVDAYSGLNFGDAEGFNVGQFANFATTIEGGIFSPAFAVFVSREVWDDISTEDRDAIMAISGEALARRAASWDAFEETSRAAMVERGTVIVEAPAELEASFEGLWAPQLQAWVDIADDAGLPGQEILGFYVSTSREIAAGDN